VKEIAFTAGYDDPAQFSKLFRQKIGLSPKQFRQALPAGE
jgi:AraC-like DNA-binding protein